VVIPDRTYDAHQLRLAGLDLPEIAQRLGYLDGRIAAMAVTAFLQKTAGPQSNPLLFQWPRPDSLIAAAGGSPQTGALTQGSRTLLRPVGAPALQQLPRVALTRCTKREAS
jgi:hypothetical protein